VELIRSGDVIMSLAPEGAPLDLEHIFTLSALSHGEYVYLRVRQTDGGLAWSSPWFIASPDAEAWGASPPSKR